MNNLADLLASLAGAKGCLTNLNQNYPNMALTDDPDFSLLQRYLDTSIDFLLGTRIGRMMTPSEVRAFNDNMKALTDGSY